jgi:hypothetical protein
LPLLTVLARSHVPLFAVTELLTGRYEAELAELRKPRIVHGVHAAMNDKKRHQ